MARTVQVIYQQMLDEKTKYDSLTTLNNTSPTAMYRTIFYVCAVAIAAFEQLNDVFKSELQTLANNLPVTTTLWYANKALEYQEGYPVVYNRGTGEVGYENIDESVQIVKVATALSEVLTIVIKVAKSDGGDGLEALTPTELSGFDSYINQIKAAGTVHRVFSLNADLIKLSINVKIDKTKINSIGQLVSDITTYPIEVAITDYLNYYSVNNFNSEFKLIKLIDAIQAVDGVNDVNITLAQARPDSSSNYYNLLGGSFETYTSESGYIIIDTTYPLRDNITYV